MTDVHLLLGLADCYLEWNFFFLQICRENQTTRFTLNKFFTKSCALSDSVENNVEVDRPQRALRVG
jgi:hypothetical protein